MSSSAGSTPLSLRQERLAPTHRSPAKVSSGTSAGNVRDNPRELISLLNAHARALAKVRALRHADLEAGQPFDSEKAEDLAIEALRPLIRSLKPEARILNRLVSSGSSKAIKTLFDVHGTAPYRLCLESRSQRDRVSLGEPVKHANLEVLKTFHIAGFNLEGQVSKMLTQAVLQRSAEYLAFVRNDLGSDMMLLQAVQPDAVFGQPWSHILGDLATELRLIAADGSSLVRNMLVSSFYPFRNQQPRLREIALCLHLIPDVSLLLSQRLIEVKSPSLLRLLEMSATNHGRLALLHMEPSLTSLLSRAKSDPFYGLTEADIHKENQ